MRNFKKFLALVLAMLMVSACAVSVSAYGDQAAIDATGYAEAVSVLSSLNVIAGDGTNFMPNGTLTRAAAAKIAAMLDTGVAGQKIEWKSSTSSFVDVDPAHWGNAYINYASQHGIMDGIGGGKFAPDADLTVAEAIVIAVKAAGLKGEVAKLNELGTPTYWAANWISVADTFGLTKDIVVFDYTALCSRAMFAQVAYNILQNVEAIEEGFGLETATAYVEEVKDGKVTLSGLTTKVSEAAFNAALATAGVEKTAADLVNYKVTMLWSSSTYAIYSISVDTVVAEADYSDAVLAYVKKDNAVVAEKINIAGVEYVVNTVDNPLDPDAKPGEIGGAVSASKNGVMISIDGANVTAVADGTIPAYYAAIGYDDDADGDYERVAVTSYDLVTLTKGSEIDHDGKSDTAKVVSTVVTAFTADGTAPVKVADKYLTVAGAGYTAWGETPVLVALTDVDEKNMTATILETAEKVTGVVSSIKADKYITITNAIEFAAAYVDPENWTLGQNVTVYTINGKYVAVASASGTGVESGMVEKTILVDKVTIADGKAVISGFYAGAAFEAVELTVAGIESGTKLVARNAYLNDKGNDVDYDKNGKVEDADKAFVAVALGTNKKDDGTIENAVVIEDNTYYTFKITSAGAYLVGKASATTPATAKVEKVTIDGAYIKENGTAKYRLADSYVVVKEAPADKTKAYNYYADTYTVTAKAALPANLSLTYAVLDANNAVVTNAVEQNAALIYISAVEATTVVKTVAGLAEGMSIVKIVSEESASLDYNTYNAIDIFSGAEVQVTGNGAEAGDYATVKDGAIVTNDTKWIGKHAITVTVTLGKVESVVGYNSYLEGEKDGADATMKHYDNDANKVTFGLDNVTIWKLDNGKFVADTDFSYEGKTEFFGFINGGKVVILP